MQPQFSSVSDWGIAEGDESVLQIAAAKQFLQKRAKAVYELANIVLVFPGARKIDND